MAHSDFWLDGVFYPSVTKIIGHKPKPWLEAWKKRLGPARSKRILDASNAIGTDFHRFVEHYIEGVGSLEIIPTLRLIGMIDTIRPWVDSNRVRREVSEFKVHSKKYKYSGTLDFIGTISLYGDELILIDWKTSKSIYPEMGLQLVAYARAYQEMTGIKIKRGLIVCVDKKHGQHKLRTREFDLSTKLFKQFLKLRRDYEKTFGE